KLFNLFLNLLCLSTRFPLACALCIKKLIYIFTPQSKWFSLYRLNDCSEFYADDKFFMEDPEFFVHLKCKSRAVSYYIDTDPQIKFYFPLELLKTPNQISPYFANRLFRYWNLFNNILSPNESILDEEWRESLKSTDIKSLMSLISDQITDQNPFTSNVLASIEALIHHLIYVDLKIEQNPIDLRSDIDNRSIFDILFQKCFLHHRTYQIIYKILIRCFTHNDESCPSIYTYIYTNIMQLLKNEKIPVENGIFFTTLNRIHGLYGFTTMSIINELELFIFDPLLIKLFKALIDSNKKEYFFIDCIIDILNIFIKLLSGIFQGLYDLETPDHEHTYVCDIICISFCDLKFARLSMILIEPRRGEMLSHPYDIFNVIHKICNEPIQHEYYQYLQLFCKKLISSTWATDFINFINIQAFNVYKL
ncbi:hypothetical protein MXB_2424, partial [Myxobolus squamalis]